MKKFISYTALTGLMLSAGTTAQGAGYLFQENSIYHGQAYAGRAAIVDSSSLFWNPATAAFLTQNEMSAYGAYVRPRSKFHAGSGTSVSLLSAPNKNGAKSAVVPALYAVYKLTDKVKFGMAITFPFGLVTDYGSNWMGRYAATKSALKTTNLNPSLSFKVNDKLAVAAGVAFQHITADLRSNLRQAALGVTDATVKLKGKDWGYGYNLGLLFEPTKGTRLGLAYRSHIRHKIKGRITTNNVDARVLVGSPYLNNGAVSANLKTPGIFNFSISQDLNAKWTVLADIMYTKWKAFKTLSIDQHTVNKIGAITEEQRWKNTFMYSLGFNYKHNDKWLFRAGGAYEKTPSQDQYRSPRLPDADRWWSAAGVDYTINQHSVVRLAYTHIFAKATKVNLTKPGANSPTTLQGKFKGKVDIIGLQYNYKW